MAPMGTLSFQESSMHTVDTLAADKGDPWAHYAFESLVEAAGPGSRHSDKP